MRKSYCESSQISQNSENKDHGVAPFRGKSGCA